MTWIASNPSYPTLLIMLLMFGVPVVQSPSRAESLELARIGVDAGSCKQIADIRHVELLHRFFLCIRAQAMHLAADIEDCFVERITQPWAGVAADDQSAGLSHERRDVTDTAANH